MHRLPLAIAASLLLTMTGCKSMPVLAPIAGVITGIAVLIDDFTAALKPPPAPPPATIEVNPR